MIVKIMNNETTAEIELQVALYFRPHINIVVPNISWGINIHECDVLVITRSNYLYEIEIKISKSDLIKDLKKTHGHNDYRNRIKKLYFSIPQKLVDAIDYVPSRAGVLVVEPDGRVDEYRKAITQKAIKINDNEKFQIARLGTIRIWNLKQKLIEYLKFKEFAKDKID